MTVADSSAGVFRFRSDGQSWFAVFVGVGQVIAPPQSKSSPAR